MHDFGIGGPLPLHWIALAVPRLHATPENSQIGESGSSKNLLGLQRAHFRFANDDDGFVLLRLKTAHKIRQIGDGNVSRRRDMAQRSLHFIGVADIEDAQAVLPGKTVLERVGIHKHGLDGAAFSPTLNNAGNEVDDGLP